MTPLNMFLLKPNSFFSLSSLWVRTLFFPLCPFCKEVWRKGNTNFLLLSLWHSLVSTWPFGFASCTFKIVFLLPKSFYNQLTVAERRHGLITIHSGVLFLGTPTLREKKSIYGYINCRIPRTIWRPHWEVAPNQNTFNSPTQASKHAKKENIMQETITSGRRII